jgi:hypothetical protein
MKLNSDDQVSWVSDAAELYVGVSGSNLGWDTGYSGLDLVCLSFFK